jgi:Cys-tRNA(Pro) deacylase
MEATMNDLSKNAQIVQNSLAQKNLNFEVIELSASTRTSEEAAEAIGCNVAQIVKSIIFRIDQTNQPILVLASGINRINERQIAKEISSKIEKADAKFSKEVTGFVIGGIPPVGHKNPIKTLIDQDLLQYKTLWAAAGTPHAVFKLNSSDLLKMTDGRVISIK